MVSEAREAYLKACAEADDEYDAALDAAWKVFLAAKNPAFIVWQDKLQAAMAQYKREAKQ